MKKLIFATVLLSGFSAFAASAVSICSSLQATGYLTEASQCMATVDGVNYDPAVVSMAGSFVSSGFVSEALTLLKNTQSRIYTKDEAQFCMNYVPSGFITEALNCMETSGTVTSTTPAPVPVCPAVPNYQTLNAMLATVESDLIANTPDSRTDAFKNLENMRAIFASFAH